ncbi:MAG: hypothetical protein ACXAB7_03730 [Candidatus Kariarchaeaceae archaeon]
MSEPNNVPIWFPLRKIKESRQITLEESIWKNYIVDRINLLGPNGKKDFGKEQFESTEEFEERGRKEIQSHVVLRLGVCMNPRLSAWFIESEGDLFQYRFMKSKWSDKNIILNFLYPSTDLNPIWLELEELSSFLKENLQETLNLSETPTRRFRSTSGLTPGYDIPDSFGINKIIGLDYRYAPFLVKTRKALLYKGWVIASMDRLMNTVKQRFQILLDDQLTEYAKRLETTAGGAMKKLAKEMNELLHSMITPKRDYKIENVILQGNFDDHIQYYPPCIQDLISTVDQVGYIQHWERFQLGLFLKHTGMDVDEQLQFWYSKAVDNIGLSYSEFVKRAGYVIRHIYGLEGGKIDYEMPSCSTIQNKMYCTFRHRDIAIINDRINSTLEEQEEAPTSEKNRLVKEINEFVSRGFPNVACAKYLQLRFNQKREKIFHPMFYLTTAAKSSGILVSEPSSDSPTDSTET